MIELRMVSKYKDKNGKIIKYYLEDTKGKCKYIKAERLKDAIRNNKINVVNLTLTSDNRLVEKKEKNIGNNISFLKIFNDWDGNGDLDTFNIPESRKDLSKMFKNCSPKLDGEGFKKANGRVESSDIFKNVKSELNVGDFENSNTVKDFSEAFNKIGPKIDDLNIDCSSMFRDKEK